MTNNANPNADRAAPALNEPQARYGGLTEHHLRPLTVAQTNVIDLFIALGPAGRYMVYGGLLDHLNEGGPGTANVIDEDELREILNELVASDNPENWPAPLKHSATTETWKRLFDKLTPEERQEIEERVESANVAALNIAAQTGHKSLDMVRRYIDDAGLPARRAKRDDNPTSATTP